MKSEVKPDIFDTSLDGGFDITHNRAVWILILSAFRSGSQMVEACMRALNSAAKRGV
ncbi:hypothetical protein [Candidatus Raskinella chloraquaticus]|uniref:hypothetical protein n=1 Tax=Candidatus Raskinella chloraquaticus TaxID=1951219 RepID=UPI00366F8F0A